MFKKILIANRGEIACRVIQTARRMGIQTVAVYSDADRNARHVRMADQALHIGPAAASQSYLVIENIIKAAQATGAQAIHPGYGFLSENAEFCQACEVAGIVFIGPPVQAIGVMGSKSEAKKHMSKAGVPLVPGYHGDNQDPDYLHSQADSMAYPVLIKPSAGGGGKGMRVVEHSGDFQQALAACKREARSSFGNDHVLLEQYLQRPRHIEVQIFADQHGQCVHLFERDCSVQRRHQKVLEEAPAPNLTPQQRERMGCTAVDAAQAVGYVGAGTVEFIVSPDGTFYFMEMNTRLQVEHPVTEMITGLDLVEWQFRVAAGQPLPLQQHQVQMSGHALEARVYAEDPSNGFLPSVGKLTHLRTPEPKLYVRVDTGVEVGDEISPHYDPMIAKLIVWGCNREQVCERMLQALGQYQVVGVNNNLAFLSRLIRCPTFASADVDTHLIEREHAALFPEHDPIAQEAWWIAALADFAQPNEETNSPWHIPDAWRLNAQAQRSVQLSCDGQQHTVILDEQHAQATWQASGEVCVELNGRRIQASLIAQGNTRHVWYNGQTWCFTRLDPLAYTAQGGGVEQSLQAPMPSKVIAVLVQAGSKVEKGTPLLVLEAMKMEHTISAPVAGWVRAFRFSTGDVVPDGAQLLDFEVE